MWEEGKGCQELYRIVVHSQPRPLPRVRLSAQVVAHAQPPDALSLADKRRGKGDKERLQIDRSLPRSLAPSLSSYPIKAQHQQRPSFTLTLTLNMAGALDALEKSILDGTFFQGRRTPSPTRSASTASNAPSSPSSSRSPSPTGMPAGALLRTSGPQTGPKGVKADRDHARQVEKEMRREQRKVRDGELRGRAVVAGDWRVQERLQREEDARRRDGAAPSSSRVGSRREQDEEDLDLDDLGLDDDDEDDEALQRYRRARILELQGGQAASSSSSAASSSRPSRAGAAQYGRLIEVDGDSYSTEIDDVPPGTSVVVHIYSDVSTSERSPSSSRSRN